MQGRAQQLCSSSMQRTTLLTQGKLLQRHAKRGVPPLLHQHNRQTASPVRNHPELTPGRTLAASTCCRRGRGGWAGSGRSLLERGSLGTQPTGCKLQPCRCRCSTASRPTRHAPLHRARQAAHLCRASTVTAASSSSAFLHTTLPIESVSISYCRPRKQTGLARVGQRTGEQACLSSLVLRPIQGPALNSQQRQQQHAACRCTTSASSGHGHQHPP